MPNVLSDAQAKDIMRKWPKSTKSLFGGSNDRPWIRAQPKNTNDNATAPYLLTAGSTSLKTQPDGMFIRVVESGQAADVVCFEVCSSIQNVQDKRSRYNPQTASLVVETRSDWWNEAIAKTRTRWERSDFETDRCERDFWMPIRHLRVVYVLKNEDLEKFREGGVPAGHEYFMRHSSLGSITSEPFLVFLEQLSPENHYYTSNKSHR